MLLLKGSSLLGSEEGTDLEAGQGLGKKRREGAGVQGAHHSLFVDDVLQPLEVLPLEASEDKERIAFILLRSLHGALGVGDAQCGLAAHVLLKAFHWC